VAWPKRGAVQLSKGQRRDMPRGRSERQAAREEVAARGEEEKAA
jgi:hypothetical protein